MIPCFTWWCFYKYMKLLVMKSTYGGRITISFIVIISIIKECQQHGFSWFLSASSVCTELMNVNFYWLTKTGVSMWRSQKAKISFIHTHTHTHTHNKNFDNILINKWILPSFECYCWSYISSIMKLNWKY